MRILYYYYKVGDKVMFINKAYCKHENTYKEPHEITQTWTNYTVTIEMGA